MNINNLLCTNGVEVADFFACRCVESSFKVVCKSILCFLDLVGNMVLGVYSFCLFSCTELGIKGLEYTGKPSGDSCLLVEFDACIAEGGSVNMDLMRKQTRKLWDEASAEGITLALTLL